MDSSAVDSLDDTPTLPELSFDDLLDESPVKARNDLLTDDLAECSQDQQKKEDETLNTPGPKKQRTALITTSKEESLASEKNKDAQIAAAKNEVMTPIGLNTNVKPFPRESVQIYSISNSSAASTTPTLLNGRNLLPKTSSSTITTTTNHLIKIAPKSNVVTVNTTSAATVSTANTVAGNKTALKAANGQIYYVQKSSANIPTIRLATTATATSSVTPTVTVTTNATASIAGKKPVSIQVLRSSDGTLIPLKPSSAVTAAAKTMLTLSPKTATQIVGKKVIANSGNPLLIKTSIQSSSSSTATVATDTATTATKHTTEDASGEANKTKSQKTLPVPVIATSNNASTTSKAAKPTTALKNELTTPTSTPGRIVVQSANGRQIVVSNPQLIKLSPKPTTSTKSAAASGQLQAVHISGKSGLHYVRILPNSKVSTAAAAASVSAATTTNASTTASVATSAATATTTSSSLKLLNAAPKKFAVVRTANGTTKMLLSQSSKNFSPITSKVQKTVVAVPTFRKISDILGSPNINACDSSNQSSSSNGSVSIQTSTGGGSTTAHPSNGSNIKAANSMGICKVNLVQKHKISDINSQIQRITSSELGTKKATGSRIVFMPRSMLRSATLPNLKRGNINVGGKSGQITFNSPKKMYSVLKATSFGSGSSADSTYPVELKTSAELKSMIICGQARALMDQQHQQKIQMLQNQQHQQKIQMLQKQRSLQLHIERQIQQQKAEKQMKSQQEITMRKEFDVASKIHNLKRQQQLNQLHQRQFGASTSLPNIKVKQELVDINDLRDELINNTALRQKHCNCTKSQCLKLYCECFSKGEFCQNCNCKDCFNNLQYEDERQKAIKNCLERNPSAFKPKITTAQDHGDMRLHNKGCNCKRSGCLKNYCECYEAKIPCSSNCRCFGCRNIDERPDLDMDPIDPKILAALASRGNNSSASLPAAQKRSYDRMERSNKQGRQENAARSLAANNGSMLLMASGPTPPKKTCNFITQEVIDATIQCMLSQADECEKSGLPEYQTQMMVMEELGRCLVEIIDFSIRNTEAACIQD